MTQDNIYLKDKIERMGANLIMDVNDIRDTIDKLIDRIEEQDRDIEKLTDTLRELHLLNSAPD